MNILIICQHFYPENFRINDIAAELHHRGHKITMLTGYPNYPEGEIYEGFKIGQPYDDDYFGVKIIRVPLHPRKKSKFHLALNYISFYKNANKWVKKNGKNYDITYSCQLSPVFMSLPCITMKKKYNIPTVINVQDLWPESFSSVTGIKNKLIISILKKISNKVYLNADRLLCSSSSFVPIFIGRGVNPENISFWPQYSNSYKLTELEIPSEYKTKYSFVFAGNIGEAQGLDVVLDAAALLFDNKEISFYLIGNGSDKKRLEKKVEENNLSNVFFIDRKPEIEIPAYLLHATAALLTLKENILLKITLPAKLQMYLSCGTPVITTISGEAGEVIKSADCGIVCDNQGQSLSDAIRNFIYDDKYKSGIYKANAKQYNNQHYDKNQLLDELERILYQVYSERLDN